MGYRKMDINIYKMEFIKNVVKSINVNYYKIS